MECGVCTLYVDMYGVIVNHMLTCISCALVSMNDLCCVISCALAMFLYFKLCMKSYCWKKSQCRTAICKICWKQSQCRTTKKVWLLWGRRHCHRRKPNATQNPMVRPTTTRKTIIGGQHSVAHPLSVRHRYIFSGAWRLVRHRNLDFLWRIFCPCATES